MSTVAALAMAFGFATPVAVPAPSREVNLDRPGVLEAIEQSNPAHYAKILVIMRISQMEPCEHVPAILKTKEGVGVDDVRCDSFVLLTSYPPKRHMTFVLDDVRYTSNVAQVQLQRPRVLPVERSFTQPLAAPGNLP
jgi:hypothetical protein